MKPARPTVVRSLAALVLATAATATGALGATAAQAADSQVYVVHGIPNTPVDVYVNGTKTLDDFAPGAVAGPLTLPEGSYDIAVTAADATDASNPVIDVKGAAVPGGANVSLVAHLTADGTPTLTPFANDVSAVPAGQARVVVRHTAAAPVVDVRAGGTPVISSLTNPDEESLTVPAGSISADVVLAGTDTVAIGPADLNLAAGTSTVVYAIGSAADSTLGLVTQTLTGLGAAPAGVGAGSGGLLDQGLPAWALTSMVAGGLLVLASGATVVVRRSDR